MLHAQRLRRQAVSASDGHSPYPTTPAAGGISERQVLSIPDSSGGERYQRTTGALHTQWLRRQAVSAGGRRAPYPTAPAASGISAAQGCSIPNACGRWGYQQAADVLHTQRLRRRAVSAGGRRALYPTASAASGISARLTCSIPNGFGGERYQRAASPLHTQRPLLFYLPDT